MVNNKSTMAKIWPTIVPLFGATGDDQKSMLLHLTISKMQDDIFYCICNNSAILNNVESTLVGNLVSMVQQSMP